MDFKTFVISIIFIVSLTRSEGFPEKTDVDERLVARSLGDYMSSWFWSSKNTEEENNIKQQDEKSNITEKQKDGDLSDDNPLSNHLESEIPGRVNADHDQETEEIIPVYEIPEDVQPENAEKILQQLKKDVESTDNEEKTRTLNLWKNLTKTVSETTSPYIEVMYKKSRHLINIGAYGSSNRSRCFTEMVNPLGGILGLLLSLFGLGRNMGENNANMARFLGLGMPPTAVSTSNSNAGALSLAGLGGAIPGNGVQYVSLIDYIKLMQNGQLQTPNLGGNQGNQGNIISDLAKLGITDLSKLGGSSQPNAPSNDTNNMILLALLMKLLSNGNNGSSKTGTDISGLDLSRLPSGNDNSGLITILKQLMNRPEIGKNGSDNDSRVFVFRSNDFEDADDENPIEMVNIRGSPEERFKLIAKKFKSNPDLREKIIIVDELNDLKNDPRIKLKPDLKNLIKEFETRIKSDDDYDEVWKIAELTSDGSNIPRKFRNIRFIDGSGDKFTTLSDEEGEKFWKKMVGSLSSKYGKKNINDPKTLKDFLKDLNLKDF